MAPPVANLRTSTSQSTGSLTLSSNLRMPHVFVVPPEEEQQDNPPWCCFDADEQPANDGDFPSDPDIHFVDVPYLLQQSEHDVSAPLARRTSIHKPRPRAPMSKKLEKKQRPEALRIIESKSRQRDAREDSDVIEVVKVKRGREALADPEENTKVKRSKTLKARATKALQSIKNVGKASRRTHVKELWTSSESAPRAFKSVHEQIHSQQAQPPTPPKNRSLSRANSRSLSQILQPVKPARVESSFTVRVASSVAPVEANHVPPATNPSSLSYHRFNNTNLSLNEVPSTLTIGVAQNRPISPIPCTKKSTSRKFSVRELHRLFSFSSSPDDPSSSPTATFTSTRSNSKPSTSTLPRDYTDDPMEEDIYTDAHLVDLDSADRKLASQYCPAFHAHRDNGTSPPRRLSDVSFEMKLDSLHFDSLSFDAGDFHVSRQGSILW